MQEPIDYELPQAERRPAEDIPFFTVLLIYFFSGFCLGIVASWIYSIIWS